MIIQGFHIHFYCSLEQTEALNNIRTKMLTDLQSIEGAGPVRNRPVGPHPLPMFEAWFHPEYVGEVLSWALENRNGFSVLIHPLTGNDWLDHKEHSIWIGEKLDLNFDVLKD